MGRRFAFLIILLASWSAFFWWTLPTFPEHVVNTGHTHPAHLTLLELSNDGQEVLISKWRSQRLKLEKWSSRDAKMTQVSLSGLDWEPEPVPMNLEDLLWTHGGLELLRDDEVWKALRQRFRTLRSRAIEGRKNRSPFEDAEASTVGLFPPSSRFTSDGRYFTYLTHDGAPVYFPSESIPDGTMIEDARTGAPIAFLPGAINPLLFDGQTALSANTDLQRFSFEPISTLTFWDLASGKSRGDWLFTGPNPPHGVFLSPDGQVVVGVGFPTQWWNAASGELLGSHLLFGPAYSEFMAGSQTLMFCTVRNSVCHFEFWDVASGRKTDQWELASPASAHKFAVLLMAANERRMILSDFREKPSSFWDQILDTITPYRTRGPEPQEILLVDLESRKFVPLAGASGRYSSNGEWLATVDEQGVIRIWQIPLRRPWFHIFLYALMATLTIWSFLHLVRRLARYLGFFTGDRPAGAGSRLLAPDC